MTIIYKLYDKIIDFLKLANSLDGVYLKNIINHNMRAIGAAAILTLIMESFMIIRLLVSHPAIDTPASRVYLVFYLSLMSISAMYLIIASNFKPSLRITYWLQFTFVAAYLLWNVLLNSYDLYRNGGGSSLALVTAIIFASILIHLRPHHMMILQTSTFALFYVMNDAAIEDKINATLAVVVAVVANLLFYVRDIENAHNQQRIVQINAHLPKEQMDGAMQYLQRLQETQTQTAIFRHDLRHTLNLIDQLAKQGNLEKIQTFIAESQENVQNISPDILCEHEAANLILGSFKQRALDKNIKFDTKINLPKKLKISDTELCSLLCNLLENALISVAKIENPNIKNPNTKSSNEKSSNENPNLKRIYIKAVVNDNKLVVLVENGYSGEIKIENGLPVTNNLEPNHGFGIQSIVDITERYKGMYIFEPKSENNEQIFSAKILLHLK